MKEKLIKLIITLRSSVLKHFLWNLEERGRMREVSIPLLPVPTIVRLIVSQGGRALHLVNDNQFLDSPEWFGVSTDEYFQVTVTALETSTILMWHRLVAYRFIQSGALDVRNSDVAECVVMA